MLLRLLTHSCNPLRVTNVDVTMSLSATVSNIPLAPRCTTPWCCWATSRAPWVAAVLSVPCWLSAPPVDIEGYMGY